MSRRTIKECLWACLCVISGGVAGSLIHGDFMEGFLFALPIGLSWLFVTGGFGWIKERRMKRERRMKMAVAAGVMVALGSEDPRVEMVTREVILQIRVREVL